jgi:hypothetical protein
VLLGRDPCVVVGHCPVDHATKELNHWLLRICVGLERLDCLGKTALAIGDNALGGLRASGALRVGGLGRSVGG